MAKTITMSKELLDRIYNQRKRNQDALMKKMDRYRKGAGRKNKFILEEDYPILKCVGCKQPFQAGELAFPIRANINLFSHAKPFCLKKISNRLLPKELKLIAYSNAIPMNESGNYPLLMLGCE